MKRASIPSREAWPDQDSSYETKTAENPTDSADTPFRFRQHRYMHM
jgi:hypothetical protein